MAVGLVLGAFFNTQETLPTGSMMLPARASGPEVNQASFPAPQDLIVIPEEKESQDALWDLLGEQPRMGAAPAQTNPLPSNNPAGSWGAVPPANPAGSPGAGPSEPYPYQPNQEEGMEGKSPIFSRIYSRLFFQKKTEVMHLTFHPRRKSGL